MLPAPTKKQSLKTIVFLVFCSICVSLFIGLLSYKENSAISRIDHFFYDQFITSRASDVDSEAVAVIDIDEASLAAIGQWPWPRYKVAELVSIISELNPSAIGLDIIFSEIDRTSLAIIKQNYKDDFGLDLTFQGVPDGLTDNDGYLGHVLAETATIGARYFFFDHAGGSSLCKEQAVDFSGGREVLSLDKSTGVLCNNSKIERNLQSAGFINHQLDDDGILRRVPLLIDNGGRIFPSISLATILQALDISSVDIGRNIYGPTLRFGDHVVPITMEGYASLRFKKSAEKFRSHSALDIFNRTRAPVDLEGKIVFIGTSAAGLHDLVHTVNEPMLPGVQVHATLVDNILGNELIIRPAWAGKLMFGVCLLTGLLMGIIFIRSSGPLLTFLATLTLCLVLITASYLFFWKASVFLSPAAPLLCGVGLFALLSSGRFAIEKQTAFEWFKQLTNTQQVTVESMATVAETRDPETGSHIKRTQYYVKAIAEELQRSGHFKKTLSEDYIAQLYLSAPLHDIGKVGVPDAILLKGGSLTEEEFELMKKHTEYGRKIIANIVNKIEGDNFLKIAGEIAYSHHEKWDGTGYPLGLAAEEIPLSARIMAVADIFDALISDRVYKKAFPFEVAREVMEEGRAIFFDPIVLDAFFRIETSIIDIAATVRDQ